MKLRRAAGDVLIVLAAAFIIYLSVIMVQRISIVVLKSSYLGGFVLELVMCAFFLLLGMDLRFGIFTRKKSGARRAAGWGLRVFVILVAALLLFFTGRVLKGCFMKTEAPADYAIVLGMALEDGKPSEDLLYRLDTAEKYWRGHPESILILTGGLPDESGRTEADVMHDILAERGVPEDRMMLDDKAANTKENLVNAAQLTGTGAPVVLISSNYHIDRAVRLAEDVGFTEVLRLPAPASWTTFGSNVMWEVMWGVIGLFLGTAI